MGAKKRPSCLEELFSSVLERRVLRVKVSVDPGRA